MEPQSKIPTIEEIKTFLKEYGWKYREISPNGSRVIIAPYALEKEQKGILIIFKIEGEFMMVSTTELLKNVPSIYSQKFLELNDKIKCIKLYVINHPSPDMIEIDMGFELWNKSWNKETFFAFMDMLGLGIEKVLDSVTTENIPHETNFITFQ